MRLLSNKRMSYGDYAFIVIRINGEDYNAAMFRPGGCRPYLITNHVGLIGHRMPNLDDCPFKASWIMAHECKNKEIEKMIAYVNEFDSNGNKIEFVKILDSSYNDEAFEAWLSLHGYKIGIEPVCESRCIPSVFTSDRYTTDVEFSGIHRYHRHQGGRVNTALDSSSVYRIGVELEVEFESNEDALIELEESKSNWFYLERDGSLDENGVEIITIPLQPKDAKDISFWKPLTDPVSSWANSWDTSTCGLHVHIGREILGTDAEEISETTGKMLYFYHHFLKDSRINRDIYGRERGYCDHDGKTEVSNAANLFGKEVLKLKDVSKKVKDSMISRSRSDRYFDINLTNSNTIEFRKGRGSLDPNRIVAVVEWSELIIKYSKKTSWEDISLQDFISFIREHGIASELINRQVNLLF